MKTLGLIGGKHYRLTSGYFNRINEKLQEDYGKDVQLNCFLYNFDYSKYDALRPVSQKSAIAKEVVYHADQFKHLGVDYIVLTDPGLQIYNKEVTKNTRLKVINMFDAIGQALVDRNMTKVLLLGNRENTLNIDYQNALRQYGVEVTLPTLEWVNKINYMLSSYAESGVIIEEHQMALLGLIESYALQGVSAVVLAHSHLRVLVEDDLVSVHVIDGVKEHINAIVNKIK